MIRPTLISCAACALAVVCVMTPAVPQAQGQSRGRFVDSGLVVVDTQTKLMWEKKSTEVGSGENSDDLHDVDNLYSWCHATGNSEAPRCFRNATSWIGQVNAESFAGFTNWRMPTREELLSIADTSDATCKRKPCIDPIFGPTQASDYWSATEVSPNVAWIVIFSSGNFRFGTKTDVVHVRAVRSGQ